MLKLLLWGLSLAFLQTGVAGQQCAVVTITDEWADNYSADFSVTSTIRFTGLTVSFTFDNPFDIFEYWQGTVEIVDSTHIVLTNEDFSAEANELVEFDFHVQYTGAKPLVVEAVMNGEDVCDGEGHWTTPAPFANPCEPTAMLPYDYRQLLCMSYLFYEAERSGPLPLDQRVIWRGDSALDDGSDVGHDLTGGYYDAGDHVKFGFPMAFTATQLGWGLIDFKEGYEAAGQVDYAKAAVKWATDYFLKAHTEPLEFYGQVGEGALDHAYWGDPESMTMARPSMKIDAAGPGSELAAETAAALAAAYSIFQEDDPTYADQLLVAAEELYSFADQYRGLYHESITDAGSFYRSWSGYGDELCWAALWLYRVTGNTTYLNKANTAWTEFTLNDTIVQYSWDDKRAGAAALGMILEPINPQWETTLKTYLEWLKTSADYTPDGLVFLDMWGANRHAANVAFLSLWAAKYGDAGEADANIEWATGQMGQLLGDAQRSYVIGYGFNPPQRPHHRSSSCPWPPASCTDGWAQMQEGPNPHTLYGALVGGPSSDGTYVDDRGDYIHNEVACDYNAAFSGALAAMIELQLN